MADRPRQAPVVAAVAAVCGGASAVARADGAAPADVRARAATAHYLDRVATA